MSASIEWGHCLADHIQLFWFCQTFIIIIIYFNFDYGNESYVIKKREENPQGVVHFFSNIILVLFSLSLVDYSELYLSLYVK